MTAKRQSRHESHRIRVVLGVGWTANSRCTVFSIRIRLLYRPYNVSIHKPVQVILLPIELSQGQFRFLKHVGTRLSTYRVCVEIGRGISADIERFTPSLRVYKFFLETGLIMAI